MRTFKENILSRTGIEIVVKEDEQAAGSAIVSFKNDQALVGYISVKRKFVGNGAGPDLLEKIEEVCKQKGAKRITGTLIPVPGSEEKVLSMVKERGYRIDKNKISLDLE